MVIEIDLREAPAAIALGRPDDFGSFKIIALGEDSPPDRLTEALSRIGRVTADGHVFVAAETLLTMAGERARSDEWLASFERMRSYAEVHEWTDATGALRAHLERSSDRFPIRREVGPVPPAPPRPGLSATRWRP